eukprot:1184161-Prorocentrum_minimum.AAC.3
MTLGKDLRNLKKGANDALATKAKGVMERIKEQLIHPAMEAGTRKAAIGMQNPNAASSQEDPSTRKRKHEDSDASGAKGAGKGDDQSKERELRGANSEGKVCPRFMPTSHLGLNTHIKPLLSLSTSGELNSAYCLTKLPPFFELAPRRLPIPNPLSSVGDSPTAHPASPHVFRLPVCAARPGYRLRSAVANGCVCRPNPLVPPHVPLKETRAVAVQVQTQRCEAVRGKGAGETQGAGGTQRGVAAVRRKGAGPSQEDLNPLGESVELRPASASAPPTRSSIAAQSEAREEGAQPLLSGDRRGKPLETSDRRGKPLDTSDRRGKPSEASGAQAVPERKGARPPNSPLAHERRGEHSSGSGLVHERRESRPPNSPLVDERRGEPVSGAPLVHERGKALWQPSIGSSPRGGVRPKPSSQVRLLRYLARYLF